MITESKKVHLAHESNIFLILLFILLSLFLITIGAVTVFIAVEKQYDQKIYPSVYIDQKDVGGKTLAELRPLAQEKTNSLRPVSVEVLYENTSVATFSSDLIRIRSDYAEILERAYLVGRTPLHLSRIWQKFTALFHLKKYDFTSRIQYDIQPITDFIQLSEEQYNKPAENARFEFLDGKVVSMKQEANGNELQSLQFLSDFDYEVQHFLVSKNPQIKIKLLSQTIKPEVSLAEANSFGIEELIAEGVSNFTHSIPERVHNLTLASTKFNGVLIPPGKEFSFNATIGDISSYTGYKPAYIIKNGRTVLGDGGGVCQVSTTLFRAALNAGLPITERHEHSYRVSYYEQDSKPGMDATVFSPSEDLKIVNNTSSHILIQTEVKPDETLLFFRLYGKKDGREVEISPIQVFNESAPPSPLYQDDPTLKRGVVKQVDFAAWGAKSLFTYKVRKNGTTIFEKEFLSVYRPWQAVFLVGTAN